MGRASLKLGISDSIVEVSLEGTIRLKEAELPRLMGRRVPRGPREEIHLVKESSSLKKNSPFEKNACESLA